MRFPFPSRVKMKYSLGRSKKTPGFKLLSDVLWTSLTALKESADGFPPLKSAVGGVVALCQIAERAKHSKSDARVIAERAKAILDNIAEAVPDPSSITPQMLQSIESFTVLLDKITGCMELIAVSGTFARLGRLNRNDCELEDIKIQLDAAYFDFLAASALRQEVELAHIASQHAQLALQHANTDTKVKEISTATSTILSHVQLTVFLAGP